MTLRINLELAVCRVEYPELAHLWDAEIDGGIRNARGETRADREARHDQAKSICQRCPQRVDCFMMGATDPLASGIYGGELVDQIRRPHHAPRRTAHPPARGTRTPAV